MGSMDSKESNESMESMQPMEAKESTKSMEPMGFGQLGWPHASEQTRLFQSVTRMLEIK